MSLPVFAVDADVLLDVGPGGVVLLDGAEGRHAATVRRIAAGETISLTDGAGRLAECVVESAGRDSLVLLVTGRVDEPPPTPRLVVVQALPKGDRGELAVETMTEVGVDAIVPWAASRCVTQWRGERGAKALTRWRSAAREAGKQSRRARFPEVTEVAGTRAVAELLAHASWGGVLHEEASSPLAAVSPPSDGDLVLVVGPEGGISPEELAAFAAAGAAAYRLGPTVLRTSTAGVVAAALVLARSGRWGR